MKAEISAPKDGRGVVLILVKLEYLFFEAGLWKQKEVCISKNENDHTIAIYNVSLRGF